jgi:hypothetical protein
MQECMNCGGPVADTDTHCTTCGLPRGSVIYGERPWSDDSSTSSTPRCAICRGPLVRVRDDEDIIEDNEADDNEADDNWDICIDCEEELSQPAAD